VLLAFVATLSIGLPAHAEPAPALSKHLLKIMSKGDGSSAATAYRVSNVHDEYEIARALNLKIKSQSLVVSPKPYDKLTVTADTGVARELWFDISSFYPEL
jgi:hypothetical protein